MQKGMGVEVTLVILLGILICAPLGQSSGSPRLQTSKNSKIPATNIKTVPDASAQLAEWIKYKKTYNLRYKTPKDELKPRNLFLNNLAFIKNRTTRMAFKDTFTLGMNKNFGTEDFSNIAQKPGCLSGQIPRSHPNCRTKKLSWNSQRFMSKDWRGEGAVRKVKDQGPCSSCWAFSAVAVLEGWFTHKQNKTVELSPQQLLDCHDKSPRLSCTKDRLVLDAFKIIKKYNGSLATLEHYPYLQQSGQKCLLKSSETTLVKSAILEFTGTCARLPYDQKEKQLKEAVYRYGPVSVSIFTQLRTFKFYKSGIYNDKECSGNIPPTHAVTVVGFGANYWIIKNSWGTDWGDGGYMKLAMGENLCGVANHGYFVTEVDDTEGDVAPEKDREPNFKVGSGSASLHGTSFAFNSKLVCLVILPRLIFRIYIEYSY